MFEKRSILSLLLFLSSTFGTILKDASHLGTYDFIVVGGGTAGNVIASRLSENPNVNVLVLEAGKSDEDLNIEIPWFAPSLAPETQWDYNYTTVPQTGLNQRSVPYARGKVFGGTSSIHYMIYTRGSQDDFNMYATLAGDKSWSWDELQYHIRKNERWISPRDGHSPVNQYLPQMHGTAGPLPITVTSEETAYQKHVMKATEQFPKDFPYNPDYNAGVNLGIGYTQASILDGERANSRVAYLNSSVLARKNLHVILNTHVTKVVKTATSKDGTPVFRAIEFSTKPGATTARVQARKEVILSAGVFGTPQLLMLSGIGNKTELAKHGIKSTVELPSVGKNLSDHTLLPNAWKVNSTRTYDNILRDPSTRLAAIQQWNASHSGPLSWSIHDVVGFLRVPKDNALWKTHADPSSGSTSPHYELLWANAFMLPSRKIPEEGSYMSVFTNLMTPASRGDVQLASANPFDSPLINPNYLGSEVDVGILIHAIRSIRKLLSANSFKNFILEPYGDLAKANTDEEIAAYARANAGSMWHACGTASMSPKNAPYGVVNPDLKVKKAEGLRIVDASVIPHTPSAHTQAAIYIFAEKGADLIKTSWGL